MENSDYILVVLVDNSSTDIIVEVPIVIEVLVNNSETTVTV